MPVIVEMDSLFDTDIVSAFQNDRGYEGFGVFYRPVSLALDKDKNFYISDLGNFTVTKFENLVGDGWMHFGHSINSPDRNEQDFRMPYGIDVNDYGAIAVADWGNNRVVLFGNNIWRVWDSGTHGSGKGQFQSPRDIAFGPDGMIYTLDTGNGRIVRLDPNSDEWLSFGAMGSGRGRFTNPQGISVSQDGRIYIADTGNHRIVSIDGISGEGWISYGHPGEGLDQFRSPRKVVEGPDGRLYIADLGNARIVRIDDMDGNGWSELTLPKRERAVRPHDIDFDKDGKMYLLLFWEY